MNPNRFLFRGDGSIIETRSRRRETALALLGGAALALAVTTLPAEDEPELLADAVSYAAGQEAGREELRRTVAAAYEQGRLDGLNACIGRAGTRP